MTEQTLLEEHVAPVTADPDKHDYWIWEGSLLVRVHNKVRRGLFGPAGTKDLPLPIERLQPERHTKVKYVDGRTTTVDDTWLDRATLNRSLDNFWTGETHFRVLDSGTHSTADYRDPPRPKVPAGTAASSRDNASAHDPGNASSSIPRHQSQLPLYRPKRHKRTTRSRHQHRTTDSNVETSGFDITSYRGGHTFSHKTDQVDHNLTPLMREELPP